MKTVLKLLLIPLMLSAALIVYSCSQENASKRMEDYTTADSMFVKNIVEDVLNPTFNTVDGMLDYCADLKRESATLDVALSMDSITIQYVFNALNPSSKSDVCLRTLVEEYLSNKTLYDNLTKSELAELEKYIPPSFIDTVHSDTASNLTH